MIDFLKGWVFNVITLCMMIVLLEILVPSGKTKKFVNLVSGLILIVAIISPFFGLSKKPIDLKDFQISETYGTENMESETASQLYNDKQMKQVAEMYRQKIIYTAEEGMREIKGISEAKADVIINDDYNSSNFGDIRRIYITLTQDDSREGIRPVAKVEKVDIKGDGKQQEAKNEEVDPQIKKQVEEKIVKLFNVPKENVVVSLKKG